MPFTPLHLGPGLTIKALAGRRFSILSFGIAQVAMDIEPLLGLVRGSSVLHGPTHTYLAALAMAIVVAIASPPLCRLILRRWHQELVFHRLGWLVESETLAPLAVIAGALVGTISHVLLDSIMHSDISPLAPWSEANALLGLISLQALHQVCILAGLLGVVGWFFLAWRKQRTGVSL
ncbi:MAG: hypothetical protein FD135_1053 [Comamonadaceae bacterium]|nr:MAG: hypothetical protein FD135_1053 [Comamonadaceae bacterium]